MVTTRGGCQPAHSTTGRVSSGAGSGTPPLPRTSGVHRHGRVPTSLQMHPIHAAHSTGVGARHEQGRCDCDCSAHTRRSTTYHSTTCLGLGPRSGSFQFLFPLCRAARSLPQPLDLLDSNANVWQESFDGPLSFRLATTHERTERVYDTVLDRPCRTSSTKPLIAVTCRMTSSRARATSAAPLPSVCTTSAWTTRIASAAARAARDSAAA